MTRSPSRSDRAPHPRGERGRLLAVAVQAFALVSCGQRGEFPVASEVDAGARRPDGVAIDPAMMLPEPEHRAGADDGVISLRAPLGSDVALATVAALFRRILREDSDGLAELFSREVQ